MKRDMESVRELLLWMEAQDEWMFTYHHLPEMPDMNGSIAYAQMLLSGGLLESSQQGVVRISWEGYEFIEKIRDPEVWRKTKEGAASVGSWSVKLLGDVAAGFIRAKAIEFGLPIA